MRRSETARCIVRLHWFLLLILPLLSGIVIADTNAKVDSFLLNELDKTGEARFIVYLKEKANLNAAILAPDWSRRGYAVYNALRATAERSQAPLVDFLNQKVTEGKARSDIASYWICNCLAVTGDKATVVELAARLDVARIAANRKIPVLDPVVTTETEGASTTAAWHIAKIRADQVWDTYGITGRGITIGSMDTGVEWTHPALLQQYRGWNAGKPDHNYNWMDATSSAQREPFDDNSHGTHTLGTIVGDDGAGNQIGVAPGAQWIAARIVGPDRFTFTESVHKGFQWMLAPTDLDGQYPDPDKRPAAVSNSWGCYSRLEECPPYEEFWDDVNAWIDAGIVAEFIAGNEGPMPGSLRWPGSYPQAFTTGATNSDDTIPLLSGRGPSPSDYSIKPNVCAPGVGVRSSILGGRYGADTGTSMAGPQVVGLVALLLEANPALNRADLQSIIQDTAIPLSADRPDNDCGWGRIDALNAVEAVLASPRP